MAFVFLHLTSLSGIPSRLQVANTRSHPAFHVVLCSPAPCFYPAAVPSSHLTIKEQLHLHSPKITFGPLKATARLMWPLVKISLTALSQRVLVLPLSFNWQIPSKAELQSVFLIKVFILVIIDSHVMVRNNTKKSLYPLLIFP